MPPRKRAASAPKPEPDSRQPDEAAADDSAANPDEPAGAEPERSDIQTGAEPCDECFPGGWAAQASVVGALGCEHGTWQRDPVD